MSVATGSSVAGAGTLDGTVAGALDDFDSRPGGSMSLLRTIVGSCLRQVGGWMPTAGAVAMLAALDIPASTARSALARLSAKGVLERASHDGVAGYSLRPEAAPMLERGDRRIFSGAASDDATWCLISFSIPEHRRDRRHQLRRRLDWIGCGTVSDALWIGPERVTDDVRDILAELRLTDEVTLFSGARPLSERPLAELAGSWWDLERVRRVHERFIARYGVAAEGAGADTDAGRVAGAYPEGAGAGAHPAGTVTGAHQAGAKGGGEDAEREAFATWIGALDEWRVIPYLDPGLPESALPDRWPGRKSAALFAILEARYSDAALAYARRLAGCGQPARTPAIPR